ncbi:MAG: hypothetical protein Q8M02_13105 [Candidatus Didemnitutus sp.]|nr:hypothetical protein [Candidatus Didemnitutus sp.]
MNLSPAAIAQRRAEIEKLNSLFLFLEKTEPRLLHASEKLLVADLAESMPRLRAYAIETGTGIIKVTFELSVNFCTETPSVDLRTTIQPPAYSKSSSSPA